MSRQTMADYLSNSQLLVEDCDDENNVPQSPKYMSRDEVLEALGYKAEKTVTSQPSQAGLTENKDGVCHRCGKKVYPVEKVDIGVLYHKGCFKCHVCSLQLTLRNFQRVVEPGSSKTKEVYCQTHVPKQTKGNIRLDAMGIRSPMDAQKIARDKHGIEHRDHHFDQTALEFLHTSELKRRKKVKRRSTLKNFSDFEKFGVFDAQSTLEKVHKEEEDELYREMFEERKAQMTILEREILHEKKRTVKDLVTWFDTNKTSKQERDVGLAKIEQYFKRQREERSRLMLQRLADEEQAAVARLIERQSQEMLFLIAGKEKEATLTLRREKKLARASQDGHNVREDASSKTGTSRSDDSQHSQKSGSSGRRTVSEIHTPGATITVVTTERVAPSSTDGTYNVPINTHEASSNPIATKNLPVHMSSTPVEDPGSVSMKVSTGGSNAHVAHIKAPNEHRKPTEYNAPLSTIERTLSSDTTVKVVPPTLEYLSPSTRPLQAASNAEASTALEDSSSSSEGVYDIEDIENVANELRDGQRITSHPKTLTKRQQKQLQLRKQRQLQEKRQMLEQQEKLQTQQQLQKQHQLQNEQQRQKKQKLLQKQQQLQQQHLLQKQQELQRQQQLLQHQKHNERQEREEESSDKGTDQSTGEGSDSDIEEDDVMSVASIQPAIVPPHTRKNKIVTSADVFRDVDKQAIEEAGKEHRTFTDLVRHLSRRCHSELQRVRSLFRWITAKDLNKIQFTESMDPDSPMGLLRGIKYGTESYHNLFKRLCSYAGIHCEVIEGYSKGAGYRPGTKFKGNYFKNQWTAVWVDGSWRFINCNWGARHVKGRKDEILTYKVDEFYFLTDPDDHIYQHFPNNSTWQLMKKPLSMDEFIRLPVVKSPFFNGKLSFLHKYDAIIQVGDGTAEIRLITPKMMGFAAKLKSRDGQIPNEILQERTYIRFIGREVVFSVNLPTPGKYILDLFVSKHWNNETMDNACSFQVYCSGISHDAHLSFPQVGTYGRTPQFVALGLAEKSHADPLISCSGTTRVVFSTTTEVKLSHTFRYWNHRDRKLDDVDRYALLKYRDNHHVQYIIICPRKGNFVFSLLAGDPDDEGTEMECVYRYLIESNVAAENAWPMPRASKRWRLCDLIEPLQGDLITRTKVRYKIKSSAAIELVVSVNGSWFSLTSNSDHVWQGIVYTAEKPGKAVVYGRFDVKKEKYIPMLEYQIKNPTMADEVKMLYKYL